jgi:hypothetical protein
MRMKKGKEVEKGKERRMCGSWLIIYVYVYIYIYKYV